MIGADKSRGPAHASRRRQPAATVLAAAAAAGNTGSQRQALLRLLRSAREAGSSGRHHHGLQAAETALQLAGEHGFEHLRSEALALLALHRFRLGQLADAIPPGLEAASLLERPADTAARAEVLCTVAMACNELGLAHDGLKYALEALSAARLCQQPLMLSWALNRAGLCTFSAVGDLEQSVALLQQARELAVQHGHLIALFSAINNLGSSYRTAGQLAQSLAQAGAAALLAQSLDYFQQAATLATTTDNPHLQATAIINLAEILTDLARYDEALAELAQGRGLARGGDFTALQHRADLAEAIILHRTGQLSAAIAVLQRVLALPGEQIEYEMRVLAHEALYRVYKDGGQFEPALRQLERLRQLEQSLADKRSSTQGWAIRKELEITSARLETERERLKAEHERLRAVRLEAEKSVAEARMSELEQAVLVDALTGVGNRRCLDREGPERLAQLQGGFDGMAVVVLDLDYFKSINDRFGHAIGDDTLRKVAQLVVLHTRSVDLVVRYGGEEFVLLLMETSQEAAVATCERLRLALMDYDWSTLHPLLHVTTSLGMAWQNQPQDWQAVLRAADLALYQAKHKGRNRLEVAPAL